MQLLSRLAPRPSLKPWLLRTFLLDWASIGLRFWSSELQEQLTAKPLGPGTEPVTRRIATLQFLSPLIARILLQLSSTLQIRDKDCSALCESTVRAIFLFAFIGGDFLHILCNYDWTVLPLWSVQFVLVWSLSTVSSSHLQDAHWRPKSCWIIAVCEPSLGRFSFVARRHVSDDVDSGIDGVWSLKHENLVHCHWDREVLHSFLTPCIDMAVGFATWTRLFISLICLHCRALVAHSALTRRHVYCSLWTQNFLHDGDCHMEDSTSTDCLLVWKRRMTFLRVGFLLALILRGWRLISCPTTSSALSWQDPFCDFCATTSYDLSDEDIWRGVAKIDTVLALTTPVLISSSVSDAIASERCFTKFWWSTPIIRWLWRKRDRFIGLAEVCYKTATVRYGHRSDWCFRWISCLSIAIGDCELYSFRIRFCLWTRFCGHWIYSVSACDFSGHNTLVQNILKMVWFSSSRHCLSEVWEVIASTLQV